MKPTVNQSQPSAQKVDDSHFLDQISEQGMIDTTLSSIESHMEKVDSVLKVWKPGHVTEALSMLAKGKADIEVCRDVLNVVRYCQIQNWSLENTKQLLDLSIRLMKSLKEENNAVGIEAATSLLYKPEINEVKKSSRAATEVKEAFKSSLKIPSVANALASG